MTYDNGWIRLTLLWIVSFIDDLMRAPIQTWVSFAVFVLTILQIIVTAKKLFDKRKLPKDWEY